MSYLYLYDFVFKPFACAVEPATGDAIAACVLEDEIIHTVLGNVNKSVINVVTPSSGLDNRVLNDVITGGAVIGGVGAVSFLNDAVTEERKFVEKEMGDGDTPELPTVVVTDVEHLSPEQFTATYEALNPAEEMVSSDLKITNRWFDEEKIPSLGGGLHP